MNVPSSPLLRRLSSNNAMSTETTTTTGGNDTINNLFLHHPRDSHKSNRTTPCNSNIPSPVILHGNSINDVSTNATALYSTHNATTANTSSTTTTTTNTAQVYWGVHGFLAALIVFAGCLCRRYGSRWNGRDGRIASDEIYQQTLARRAQAALDKQKIPPEKRHQQLMQAFRRSQTIMVCTC
jgi:hypothetical protein